ncbi:DUF6789 family protein [Halalkalicoccus salilacus]|uniref:DUF6789 family protein n=1 Tax=Halalkalicoccus sp. GCM10025704 TaxID=3252662 RepID=UPI00361E5A64
MAEPPSCRCSLSSSGRSSPRGTPLPPGAAYATIFWIGFLIAFWPGGGVLTIGLFLVVSLVSHWIYGMTLGYVLDATVGIPQHDV